MTGGLIIRNGIMSLEGFWKENATKESSKKLSVGRAIEGW